MKHRVYGSMMAMAAVLAVVSLAPVTAAGQAPAAGRWNPPRLPDGQPDMQGLWIADAVGAAHSVEDGREESTDITKPWKMAITINRNKEKGFEQWEDAKHEGDHDVENILLTGRLEKEAGRTGIHEHRRVRSAGPVARLISAASHLTWSRDFSLRTQNNPRSCRSFRAFLGADPIFIGKSEIDVGTTVAMTVLVHPDTSEGGWGWT